MLICGGGAQYWPRMGQSSVFDKKSADSILPVSSVEISTVLAQNGAEPRFWSLFLFAGADIEECKRGFQIPLAGLENFGTLWLFLEPPEEGSRGSLIKIRHFPFFLPGPRGFQMVPIPDGSGPLRGAGRVPWDPGTLS